MVEIGEDGDCRVRELPLTPKRDVREIQGLLAEMETGAVFAGNPQDYLYVKLLDRAMPVNAMSRLRVRFPNVVDVDVVAALSAATHSGPIASLRELDDITLFDTFIKAVTGSELNPEERVVLAAAIDGAQAEEGSS